VISTVNCSYTS